MVFLFWLFQEVGADSSKGKRPAITNQEGQNLAMQVHGAFLSHEESLLQIICIIQELTGFKVQIGIASNACINVTLHPSSCVLDCLLDDLFPLLHKLQSMPFDLLLAFFRHLKRTKYEQNMQLMCICLKFSNL